MEMEVKKKGLLERFLRGVEVLGNKIPNPMLLFISLCIIVVLASAICSFFNVSAVNPVTGETVEVVNLLTKDGFIRMLTNFVTNFTGTSAMGLTLTCMLGVGAAGGSEAARKAAETYGYQLGLAFQIRDDMLDVIGNADEFGKPIGSDKDEGKVTYVDLLGLDDCGKLVHELTEQAVSAASDLDRDGFLTALAESLTERTK